jgi:hypothetical protein
MNKTITVGQFASFGIPIFVIGLIVFISNSTIFNINPHAVSIGITLDLILTVPLLHFFLIRKTSLPKITILPFFIIGLLVATIILPAENQQLLHFSKTWILPIVELVVLLIVVLKVREAISNYNHNKELAVDFFTALKSICSKLLPGYMAIFLASEIAVIYYGFIRWRKIKTSKHEFTYHKHSATMGLLITLIFLVLAETTIMHLLIAKWSLLIAWILTALSIYTSVQLLGFLKSIPLRPISITNDKVFLRYGILSETTVTIENIESVDISNKFITFDTVTRSLSPFRNIEGHNVIIRLKEENVISGLYGINRKFRILALHVDNKDEFKRQIDDLITSAS